MTDLDTLAENIRYALSHLGKSVTPLDETDLDYPFYEYVRAYHLKMVQGSRRWFDLYFSGYAHDKRCQLCGQPVPKVRGWHLEHLLAHGNRRYCSNACRQRGYRKRKAVAL